MLEKFNYFNIVKISPWPFMTSMSLMNFFFSLWLLIKTTNLINFYFSILFFFFCVIFWFMDLNYEVNFLGMESMNLITTMKLFFFLFILSELMVFFSLFWANYWFFYVPDNNLMMFSLKSIKFFDYKMIPMLNTFILISSSITITLSHLYMNKGKKKMMLNSLIITIILGLIFTYFQYTEYKNSFFNINDSCYGSIFFTLTGLHGIHVILGNLVLKFCTFKMIFMEDLINKFDSFEMGVWYWHFVDLMWLFVIYSLYFLNN
nr:cytochrome c oxidase subunit III [Nothopoda sp.]